ncbi:MAG: lysyl oxidase family protein [bacterium]|nr:lysyl oxidase family protein [bacterium]
MQYRWILIVIFLLGTLFVAYVAWAQYSASPDSASTTAPIVGAPEEPVFVDTTDPNELVPDLVPLPPQDVKLQIRDDGAVMLLFSTTYYNQGRGAVELRADPKTKGVRADLERNILQRIYLKDGTYREKVVGNFMWHQTHLHYHFADFVMYDLEAVDAPDHPDLSGVRSKSTFCLRDVSRVEMKLSYRAEEAAYRVCYKEIQGVSVGWGDTYFYDYPDQGLNISDLASGTYRLSFYVNPEQRLEEISLQNNISSAILEINMEERAVRVLEQTPEVTPPIEHIHLEQPFGLGI